MTVNVCLRTRKGHAMQTISIVANVLLVWSILTAPLVSFGNSAAAQSSTEIQLHYGDGFRIGRNANPPTFSNTTRRQITTLEHFSRFESGDLFFFVDFFRDLDDAPGTTGRTSNQYGEIYFHLSGRNLGLNLSDNTTLDLGFGLNQGTDFTVALVGPRLKFNAPGFRNLSLGLYGYHNVTDPFDRDLDTTYQATLIWDVPFEIGAHQFTTKGFVDFIGPQGSGVDNQIVFSPQLRWDLGNALGQPANKFHLGVEYTRFVNKFGNSGVDEDAMSVFLAAKF